MNNVKYDVNDMPKAGLLVGLSFQHLFAMFGATVLVPILVGIDPAIALFSSGLGTLAHLTVTKYKIPAYMGSSFAYIAAMQMLMKTDGIAAVAQGAMAGGLVYLIVALVVKYAGNAWIDRVLPPIVVGPIIIVIGLSLAANAVKDATMVNDTYSIFSLVISMVTLFAVILFNMYGKKIIGVIPILLGLIVGYIFSVVLGWLTGHEFVYDYPAEHVKEHTIDLTEEASMDSVPLFVQWDKRWGYEKYSGNFFAASGCGPTTLSMVVVYLTHNREASPIAVAKYSKEAGYSVDGSGSSWTLISEGCRHYGVKAKTVALDESRMKAELDEGHPIVVNVGPGDFTDTGHFMVITGYDDEGFSINDPNSIEKSGKRWLFKNISSQIRAVWSMYV